MSNVKALWHLLQAAKELSPSEKEQVGFELMVHEMDEPVPGSREWYAIQACAKCGGKESEVYPFVWLNDEVLQHELCPPSKKERV